MMVTISTEKGVYFVLNAKSNKPTEALLLNSGVTDNCFVTSVESLFNDSFTCPMVFLLSIKNLMCQNDDRIQLHKCGTEYSGTMYVECELVLF